MTETVTVDGAKLRRFLTMSAAGVCAADEYDRLHGELLADLPPEPEPVHDPDVVAALTRARGQFAVDPASREILRRLADEGHEVVPVGAVRDAVLEGERRIADLEAERAQRVEDVRADLKARDDLRAQIERLQGERDHYRSALVRRVGDDIAAAVLGSGGGDADDREASEVAPALATSPPPSSDDIDGAPEVTYTYGIPDKIAVDAKGFGWRVWNDHDTWSMVPTNPNNDPIPEPVTWFVREPPPITWGSGAASLRARIAELEADVRDWRDRVDSWRTEFEKLANERDRYRAAVAEAVDALGHLHTDTGTFEIFRGLQRALRGGS